MIDNILSLYWLSWAKEVWKGMQIEKTLNTINMPNILILPINLFVFISLLPFRQYIAVRCLFDPNYSSYTIDNSIYFLLLQYLSGSPSLYMSNSPLLKRNSARTCLPLYLRIIFPVISIRISVHLSEAMVRHKKSQLTIV